MAVDDSSQTPIRLEVSHSKTLSPMVHTGKKMAPRSPGCIPSIRGFMKKVFIGLKPSHNHIYTGEAWCNNNMLDSWTWIPYCLE